MIGVAEAVRAKIVNGWSAKKSILGRDVYNEAAKPEKVGKAEDIIMAPRKRSHAIVNASKYVGLSSHLVAVHPFKREDKRITLPGATTDGLRNVPVFHYAKTP